MWCLSEEVNKSIEKGSKPQGGIAVYYDYRTGETEYIQAMVDEDGV